MICRLVSIAIAYALGTSALLLQPEVLPAASDASVLGPGFEVKNQVVRIPCSGCAFVTRQETLFEDAVADGDEWVWTQGGATDLLVNLTISEDGERLELNGGVVYPSELHRDAFAHERSIYVYQVPAATSGIEITSDKAKKVPLEVTSFGLTVGEGLQGDSSGAYVIRVRFGVFAVESQPVDIAALEVYLVQKDKQLSIGSASLTSNPGLTPHEPSSLPTEEPPLAPGALPDMSNEKECRMLPQSICKFRNVPEVKLARLRHGRPPCRGRKGHRRPRRPSGHTRPHSSLVTNDEEEKPRHHRNHHHHGQPHHMRSHKYRHHHHGQHQRDWVLGLARGFIAVLIPVVAGISVGLSVSLVGLLVVRLVSLLWTRFTRNGWRGYASLAHGNHDDKMEDGKGLMLVDEDVGEASPTHEDAPAYKETAKQ